MAHASIVLPLWILLLTSNLSPVQSSYQPLYVYIDAVSGEDSRKCLNSNSTVKACQSLSFVANNLTQTNSVNIEIVCEWLNLTDPIEFRSYTHLTISGSEKTTLHCNESNAGLAFVRVKNLTIRSITIDQCGALRESTSVDPQKPNETERLSVAVYLLNCTDVTIWRVDIQSSDGTGLSMYDTNGTVNIEFSNFTNNSAVHPDVGGGGLHIEFTICSPGIVGKCSNHNGSNHLSNYNIQNCVFSYNVASSPIDKHSYISPSPSRAILRTGKGGGLYISVGSNASHNIIIVAACNFTKNQASFDAGGMLVEYLNSVQNNKISVVEANFLGNDCLEMLVCSSGGLAVDFIFYVHLRVHGIVPANNNFSCSNCTFGQNKGLMGGGLSIFATKSKGSDKRSSITFSDCSWMNNTSPVGAAVYISPAVWDIGIEGFLPVPLFSNCVFESNSAHQILEQHSNGIDVSSLGNGALFICEWRVKFQGSTIFRNNSGSAIYLSASILEFSAGSSVSFVNNSAHNGGAIAMYGSSVIHINNDSMFDFTNNKAYSSGGAIYTSVVAALQSTYRNCFIQSVSHEYFKTDSTFSFKENSAHVDGNSIFATTFRPCKRLCTENTHSSNPEAILQCIAKFVFLKNQTVTTHPHSFSLNEPTPVKVIPGSDYSLNLSVTDEANRSLSGIVYGAEVQSHDHVRMNSAFSEVSNNTINLLGTIGGDALLYLYTSDITLSFSLKLSDCKPGFTYNNGTKSCECAESKSDYMGLINCNYIQEGYWMGFCSNNSKTLCTAFCPYGFCSYHEMIPNASIHPLPSTSNLLDSQICGPYRTGRVCSQCAENHSVYFHSWKYSCRQEDLCYLGWFFYLISEILPVTFFFVIILVFNISFTNGNIIFFVFFAQILDALATNAVEFSHIITTIRTVLTFLYRPFNLDFFYLEQLSFCLWKGSTVMDVLLMKYATVGFALVLVVLTILIVKYRCVQCKIFAKFHTPKSVLIHGLSAFFVMCYSQSARVTFQILDYFCLSSADSSCLEKVVYRIGYMKYFHGDHVIYAIIAIFVLVFMIIIPPLLLIVYPLVFKLLGLCKLSESKLAGVLWRVMPIQLLDSFQSSFKDNFRFFAGFYFFYRAIVLAAYAICRRLLQFYSVVQLQLILVLAVHAILQPYKEKTQNLIDALLFTLLAIINGITLYNIAEKDFKGRRTSDVVIMTMGLIQALLISLPFLCVLVLGIMKLMKWRKRVTNIDELPALRSVESTPLIR